MSKFRTSMYFDMRAPDFGAPARELYAAALEMARFADRIGIDQIGLMEHHGCEDGYLANPMVMGAAVAACTRHVRISLGAIVLPLHNPLRVAEDIAILDQLSGGRIEVIFGAGYVPSEFARFGVSLHDRASLMDRGIELILRALSGDRVDAEGREIIVRPLPIQHPHDILLVGGGVKASARRAARFDLGFAPANPKLFALYEAEMRAFIWPRMSMRGGPNCCRTRSMSRALMRDGRRRRGCAARHFMASIPRKRCVPPAYSRSGRRISCWSTRPAFPRMARWASCPCWAGLRRKRAGAASASSKRSCQGCVNCSDAWRTDTRRGT
jgi:hypothetical protein